MFFVANRPSSEYPIYLVSSIFNLPKLSADNFRLHEYIAQRSTTDAFWDRPSIVMYIAARSVKLRIATKIAYDVYMMHNRKLLIFLE